MANAPCTAGCAARVSVTFGTRRTELGCRRGAFGVRERVEPPVGRLVAGVQDGRGDVDERDVVAGGEGRPWRAGAPDFLAASPTLRPQLLRRLGSPTGQ
ncbi:hypothetical protein [Streptomyces avermitilis]|uniref:hypothetical protein n=1 Tax=Streptomyces avermitilis TaxID=33903 RepID=UPI0033B83863